MKEIGGRSYRLAVTVDALYLGNILFGRVRGVGITGKPTFITFHAGPETRLRDIVPEDAATQIDIVFDFEKVEAFPLGGSAPGWQVNCMTPIEFALEIAKGLARLSTITMLAINRASRLCFFALFTMEDATRARCTCSAPKLFKNASIDRIAGSIEARPGR